MPCMGSGWTASKPDFTHGSFCESEEQTGPRAVPGTSGPSQVPSGRRNRARVHTGSLTKSHPSARASPRPSCPGSRARLTPWTLGHLCCFPCTVTAARADSAGTVASGGPGQHRPLTPHPRLGRATRQVGRFQPTELTTPLERQRKPSSSRGHVPPAVGVHRELLRPWGPAGAPAPAPAPGNASLPPPCSQAPEQPLHPPPAPESDECVST